MLTKRFLKLVLSSINFCKSDLNLNLLFSFSSFQSRIKKIKIIYIPPLFFFVLIVLFMHFFFILYFIKIKFTHFQKKSLFKKNNKIKKYCFGNSLSYQIQHLHLFLNIFLSILSSNGLCVNQKMIYGFERIPCNTGVCDPIKVSCTIQGSCDGILFFF